MEHKKRLFTIDRKDIKVTIDLGFDGENLKLDGYDIGKTVNDIFGDSDYEYSITIISENLPKLYEINNVEFCNKRLSTPKTFVVAVIDCEPYAVTPVTELYVDELTTPQNNAFPPVDPLPYNA